MLIFISSLTISFDAAYAGSGDRKGTLNQLPNYSPSGPYKLYFEMPNPDRKYMNKQEVIFMLKNALLLAALVIVLSAPYEANSCPQHDSETTYTSP